MYTKTNSTNFDENITALEWLALESDLYYKLERGEFVVYYQPQIDLLTGRMVGMEALVRWNHPDWGLLAPTQFISWMEDTGLIGPINEWILLTACAQNKTWQDAGFPPLRVAVNISAYQFEDSKLIETVARVLEETRLAPCYLELEINERIAMENIGLVIRTLQKLKGMGIQLSIDDFGTGYSSLRYLKDLPVHTLKIDRSFLKEISTNPYHQMILTMILDLAYKLDLNVIAEGVETGEQLEFLKQRRCNEIQGYLFSKPVPAKEFEKMLMGKKRFAVEWHHEGHSAR
jgi:EAL domain-containing protein (putative c-di-GMP-specific phosphodiesterase class I)